MLERHHESGAGDVWVQVVGDVLAATEYSMLAARRRWMSRRRTLVAVAWICAGASTVPGCAWHLPQQVKEVAYDFSDRDFYDRAYAPSPRFSEDGVAPGLSDSGAHGPCDDSSPSE